MPSEDESNSASDYDTSSSSNRITPSEIQELVRVKNMILALPTRLWAKEMEVESLHGIIKNLQKCATALEAKTFSSTVQGNASH